MEATSEHITIKISQDGYEANLYDDGSRSDASVTLDDLRTMLQQAGVVHGALQDSLQGIVDRRTNGQPVVVARGSRPIDGKDGWVEYYFDHEKARPAEEKSGKVDLREMHYIHNVRRNEQLALVHPPVAGVSGTTVTGRIVLAREGKNALIRTGPYTQFKPENPCIVVANSDGNVILRSDGTIEVQPALTIRGNVDFSTGNIDFVGSLKVAGDIKSDFTVKVEKDLEVWGNIEDAHVQVGGDVKVRQGFLGIGKGVLTAKGNISVQHILNQTITGEKDVVIEKESVNGNIRAGRKIISVGGTIAGGQLEADMEVEVKNLGSGEHSQARLRVGRKGRILERLGQLEKEIQQAERQLTDVKDGVFRLIRAKLDTGNLPEEKEQMLVKLQEVQKALPLRLQLLQKEKTQLTEDLKKDCVARVVVHGTVLENVLIEVNGARTVVENALQDVIFVERGGTVEVRSP
jgi:hypothetical protein